MTGFASVYEVSGWHFHENPMGSKVQNHTKLGSRRGRKQMELLYGQTPEQSSLKTLLRVTDTGRTTLHKQFGVAHYRNSCLTAPCLEHQREKQGVGAFQIFHSAVLIFSPVIPRTRQLPGGLGV